MTSPPGVARNPDRNLTDLRPKRNRRAEAERHRSTRTLTHTRVAASMRAVGITPMAWQVEALVRALESTGDAPTYEDFVRGLMAAPWARKPSVRQWRVGETAWRVAT